MYSKLFYNLTIFISQQIYIFIIYPYIFKNLLIFLYLKNNIIKHFYNIDIK